MIHKQFFVEIEHIQVHDEGAAYSQAYDKGLDLYHEEFDSDQYGFVTSCEVSMMSKRFDGKLYRYEFKVDVRSQGR